MAAKRSEEKAPYVGYKQTVVDKKLINIYTNLTRADQRKIKKDCKKINETKYSYLEAILIDYERANTIADSIIKKVFGYDDQDRKNDLVLLMLSLGIGVEKRTPEEISLIIGEKADDINSRVVALKDIYADLIDIISDYVWQELNFEQDNERNLANLSTTQKSYLKVYSHKQGLSEQSYLNNLINNYKNAQILAREALEGSLSNLNITQEDLTMLLIYCGIGVTKKSALEMYILASKDELLSEEDYIIKRALLISKWQSQMAHIYDAVIESQINHKKHVKCLSNI